MEELETITFSGLGGLNVNAKRPWIGKNGKAYITVMRDGKPAAMQVNAATLRKDEWKQYDMAVVRAVQDRIVGTADLRSRGLVYSIGNGLGKTVLEYEDVSDFNDAHMSMDGLKRGENEALKYDLKSLPLPIIAKDFQINERVLAASRNGNMPIDTTNAVMSALKVADFIENLLFNGSSSFKYGGGTIYGYTDYPTRNTGTLATAWNTLGDSGGITPAEIVKDVVDMKQASLDKKQYGPWMLYIPAVYETVLDQDYDSTTSTGRTIRQRILEIGGILDIKPVDKLATGNILLVQMRQETVRLVDALPVQTLQWNSEGGLVHHFKVMTIQVPQIRGDQAGNCGIVHYALAG